MSLLQNLGGWTRGGKILRAVIEVVSSHPSRSLSLPSGAYPAAVNQSSLPSCFTTRHRPGVHATTRRLATSASRGAAASVSASKRGSAAPPSPPEPQHGNYVTVPGVFELIPRLWLLDHCPCPDCLCPETGQRISLNRMHHRNAVPTVSPVPRSSDGWVEVTWTDEKTGWVHETAYDPAWLSAHAPGSVAVRSRSEKRSRRRLDSAWTTFDQERSTFSYAETVGDRSRLAEVRACLEQHGLALITGSPTDRGVVMDIARAVGGLVRPTFYGDEFTVEIKRDAENLAYTGHAIPLHQDLLYFDTPPGLQYLLAAEQSITVGGETFFVDGLQVIKLLAKESEDLVDALETIPVTYQYNHGTERRQFRRTVIERDLGGNGRVNLAYSIPWMGTIEVADPNNANRIYDALGAFDRIAASIKPFEIRLPRGTCVIFDNRRILHGRSAFTLGEGEERVLHGCYSDIDDFDSLVRYDKETRK